MAFPSVNAHMMVCVLPTKNGTSAVLRVEAFWISIFSLPLTSVHVGLLYLSYKQRKQMNHNIGPMD